MTIAIINAMHKEHEQIVGLLADVNEVHDGRFAFVEGKLNGQKLVLMESGIGKVNAAVGAVELIKRYHPDALINTGVAGGADKSINVMDIVVGERVSYHDVWCGPECKMGVVQGLPNYFEGDKSIISKLPPSQLLKYGLIVSGDHFVESIEKVNKIKENYPEALAVDMESGAIAHVCEVMKVPFLSLRVISDSPGASRNSTCQYNDFWEDAPKHTFEIVETLLNNL